MLVPITRKSLNIWWNMARPRQGCWIYSRLHFLGGQVLATADRQAPAGVDDMWLIWGEHDGHMGQVLVGPTTLSPHPGGKHQNIPGFDVMADLIILICGILLIRVRCNVFCPPNSQSICNELWRANFPTEMLHFLLASPMVALFSKCVQKHVYSCVFFNISKKLH